MNEPIRLIPNDVFNNLFNVTIVSKNLEPDRVGWKECAGLYYPAADYAKLEAEVARLKKCQSDHNDLDIAALEASDG